MRTWQRAVAALVLALVSLAGCALIGGGGPSEVAQGRYFASGDPEYDEFFIELYRLQVRMATAPAEQEKIPSTLVRSLGLGELDALEVVEEKLRHRAEELRAERTLMRLSVVAAPELGLGDVDREGSVPVATLMTTGKPNAETQDLVAAIERAANAELGLLARMVQAKDATKRLALRAVELEGGVQATFRQTGVVKQNEVERNLTDAKKVIPLLEARAEEVAAEARRWLEALRRATDTDNGRLARQAKRAAARSEEPAGAATDSEPEAEPASKPKPRGRPRARPAPAAKPTPAPAPKPAPKPAAPSGGGEFEP